jgi:hypothetical protein
MRSSTQSTDVEELIFTWAEIIFTGDPEAQQAQSDRYATINILMGSSPINSSFSCPQYLIYTFLGPIVLLSHLRISGFTFQAQWAVPSLMNVRALHY